MSGVYRVIPCTLLYLNFCLSLHLRFLRQFLIFNDLHPNLLQFLAFPYIFDSVFSCNFSFVLFTSPPPTSFVNMLNNKRVQDIVKRTTKSLGLLFFVWFWDGERREGNLNRRIGWWEEVGLEATGVVQHLMDRATPVLHCLQTVSRDSDMKTLHNFNLLCGKTQPASLINANIYMLGGTRLIST